MLKSFSMLVLLMSAVPALAGAESPSSPAGAKANDPKRKICEAVEETGSRLSSKRICMTAEQWEAQNRKTSTSGKRGEKSDGERGSN